MYVPSPLYIYHVSAYANLNSYDSFKIFMGLPTTGGGQEQKQGK